MVFWKIRRLYIYMVYSFIHGIPSYKPPWIPQLGHQLGPRGWLILAEFSPHPINQVMVTMSDVYDVYDICDDFDDYSTVYCLNLYKHEMYGHIR